MVAFRWPAKGIPGKFVERNQIDLAHDSADEFDEPARIVGLIIHPGQQYVLEGEPSGRRQRVTAAGGEQCFERGDTIGGRHQAGALFLRCGIQRDGQIDAEWRNIFQARRQAGGRDRDASRRPAEPPAVCW